MRGKKSDSEFISDFITQCVTTGVDTPELIVNYAKNIICGIDEEIKKIEQKKIYRSKILDVINTFQKSDNKNKLEEAKILNFFKIQNPNFCKIICNDLKNKGLTVKDINEFYISSCSELDLNFCIKQLIEFKVIAKVGESFLRGERFDEYLQFLMKD